MRQAACIIIDNSLLVNAGNKITVTVRTNQINYTDLAMLLLFTQRLLALLTWSLLTGMFLKTLQVIKMT